MRTPSYKEDCGCAHDGRQWLVLCPAHAAEELEIHTRWAAEHAAQSAPTSPGRDVHV